MKTDKNKAEKPKKGTKVVVKAPLGGIKATKKAEPKAEKPKQAAREGAGRPTFVPTNHERNLVVGAIAAGANQTSVAITLKISKKTLIKHFRKELDKGYEIDEAEMAGIGKAMAMKALNDPKYIPAFALYVKGKYGFVDKTQIDHTSSDGSMATKAPILLMP